MRQIFSIVLTLAILTGVQAEKLPLNFSMVISGGVSLGAYEAGYNWTLMHTLSKMRHEKSISLPPLFDVRAIFQN